MVLSPEHHASAPAQPGRSAGRGLAGLLAKVPIARTLDSVAESTALDPAIGPLRSAVRGLPLGSYRDVLHGTWQGHPFHPALVQVPMGAWMSASALDLLPGTHRASRALVGLGLAGALPAALSGWADWAEGHEQQMRTGLVHATCNAVAVGLYACSFAARSGRRRGKGRLLALAGLATAGAGAVVGGHLAFHQATGANKAEPVPHLIEPGWHAVGRADSFTPGRAMRAVLGEVPLLVYREEGQDGAVRVLADRCSHFSGPLSGGEVSEGCVECPWHGSVFRLADGANVRGPATAPQPVFDTRIRADGVLEVMLPGAG